MRLSIASYIHRNSWYLLPTIAVTETNNEVIIDGSFLCLTLEMSIEK